MVGGETRGGVAVDRFVSERDQLSAALLGLEDRFNWEPVSMRRRALDLSGDYGIASQPGEGTVVTLVLPVQLAVDAAVGASPANSDGVR